MKFIRNTFKTVAAIMLTLAVLTSLSSCFLFDRTKSYEMVEKYVKENIDALESLPFDDIPSELYDSRYDEFYRKGGEEEFIKEHLGRGSMVKGAHWHKNRKILSFNCGGSGNAVHSEYTGFYYSVDDEPYGKEFDSSPMTQVSDNEWVFVEIENWQFTRTIKIMDHWYYYYEMYY
ncbi:MAG: hypothetical protein IJS45_07900 [Clostridia bacterium]|nr:hypothetical protein [Clostridia bacterium]